MNSLGNGHINVKNNNSDINNNKAVIVIISIKSRANPWVLF